MGFIDPMVIGNTVATGVLDFGSGPILWALTLALLSTAATAIWLSYPLRRLTQLNLPRLAHTELVAATVCRAK